ncbi:MAG: tetratricopeptide repeat protein [Algoriphagus sp.]|uniref:tetratricopeptide repeat protein n=1 Tax=Algoriphagus sp. TaxID=1872435 RepID=UPI0017FF4320|nr:tetratricopeptide repeat protein [Algoriphagus sp.]NVJ84662.1 tetratricopeptide repeat protein [Algoriphagus sp.]
MEILAEFNRFSHSVASRIGILFLGTFLVFSSFAWAQEDLEKAFQESYSLENAGNYQGAIQSIQTVYKSDSYEMNLRLGWLHYQASQLEESLGFYRKAVSLKPYAIEPKLGLVLPLSVQGKWMEVEDVYLKILQIDPQNTLVNYRLGLIYYNRGNYEKAEPYLEKVVNLYPFDYDGLLLLAWNKLQLQKNREATVLFQKVLLFNPGDASAKEGLALLK